MKNRTVLMLLFIICSFFLPTLKFSAQTIPRSPTSNPIPDTDQVQSYTDTFGEDSDYLINQPSYTKLDASGNDLPDSASSWTMVLDNVTGLIWEVKTDDNSIHDKDNTYNWQNAHDVFLAQLNAANFGGFNDWRLPTIKELLNIVYRDSVINTYIPTINLNYFPNCKASYTYSSTSSADTGTGAWAVNFYSGIGEGHQKGEAWYVRAVRGEQAIENNFIINGDGTVTDEATGLMWQQETAGPMKWESALAYCESLNLGGYE